MKPDTTYTFIIEAICGEIPSEHSKESDEITTKPDICSAPHQPFPVQVMYNRIILQWKKPENHSELVNTYSVVIHKDDEEEVRKTQKNEPYYIIDKLNPATVYTFEIYANCSLGFSSRSKKSKPIETTKEECTQPGKPEASHITHNSTTLKWETPEEGFHLIKHYEITCYPPLCDKNNIKTDAFAGYVVEPLEPDTIYTFKVKAICSNATSSIDSESSDEIRTKKQTLLNKYWEKMEKGGHDGRLIYKHLLPIMKKDCVDCTPTEQVSHAQVRRYTLGIKSNRPEKVILLVGITGAGKSTMINGIVNHAFGVTFSDNERIKLIYNEKPDSQQAESQTEKVTAYTFYWLSI